jgi:hypothetical protein
VEREQVERVLARVAFGQDGDPRGAHADDAAWLALTALGARVKDEVERLLAGTWWQERLRGERVDAGDGAGGRDRVALALLLRAHAADRETGAAERTACALACLAIGCADEEAGRALQHGLAHLDLLDIVKQIPVAARVRTLALEFRFRRLGDRLPAKVVARVQDLLERFDREGLLGVALRDRASPEQRARALEVVALAGGDPALASLLRALLRGPADAKTLAAACADDAPAAWPKADARAVARACGRLAKALADGPWRVRKQGATWALVSP